MRKTLKQKLRSQLRTEKQSRLVEHELAGITINREAQLVNAASIGHALMAVIMEINRYEKTSESVEKCVGRHITEYCQNGISNSMIAMVTSGLTHEEANSRISRGH